MVLFGPWDVYFGWIIPHLPGGKENFPPGIRSGPEMALSGPPLAPSGLRRLRRKALTYQFYAPYLEAIAKPYFTVILNEVKDLKSIKIRDSSLCSE
jgi:hypothetical protein